MFEGSSTVKQQVDKYASFYRPQSRWGQWLKFDVRYRSRRIREVVTLLGLDLAQARVLDVGFGGGQMLKAMPKCCRLTGAEISVSAVENANADPEFKAWKSASFELIAEDDAEALPRGPFDVILSSHTLEHVPDDRAALAVIRDRLAPEGLLFLFVPIEEPNYNPDHIRNYSVDSIAALVGEHLEVIHVEPSMHINGHIWKIITIPSRRKWWGLQWVVDRFRRVTLASIPYEGQRKLDAALDWIGVGPRQALVVARRSA